MRESDYKYLYFDTIDFTGNHTTSGYSHPNTPFTFVPTFDDGEGTVLSKQRIFWDFGDGTTSESVTATHYYKLPGWYTVKCIILGKEGKTYNGDFRQSIYVRDILEDSLVFANVNDQNLISLSADSDKLEMPITINRTNSWQSYGILSSVGYPINLYIDSSNAPIINSVEYENEKYGHLKPYARFLGPVYDSSGKLLEYIPTAKINSPSKEIYALYKNGKFLLNGITKNTPNSFFVGTSASDTVYFIDDIFQEKEPDDDSYVQIVSSVISCDFDTKNFNDPDNQEYTKPEQLLRVINTIKSSAKVVKFFENIKPNALCITSNGLDDGFVDNNGNISKNTKFDIHRVKYTNTKIPFVVRAKDTFNSSCKFYPNFKLISNENDLDAGEIFVSIIDENNQPVSATIYDNFGNLASLKYGGFYKGYFTIDQPVTNVRVYAKTELDMLIQRSSKINDYIIQQQNSSFVYDMSFDKFLLTLNENTLNLSAGSVQSVCVSGNSSGATNYWFIDSELDAIGKYNIETKTTQYAYVSSYGIPCGVPYHSAMDKDGNLWVTLNYANSSILIDYNFQLLSTITTTVTSTGIISPICVALDPDSNVWITYQDSEGSSFIERYPAGSTISNYSSTFNPKYDLGDIIIDSDSNIWMIGKDKTNVPNLLDKQDVLIKMTNNEGVYSIKQFSFGGSLWNLTFDIKENVYITKNYSEVINVFKLDDTYQTIQIHNNYVPNGYDSPLKGIACTLKSVVLILDDYNKAIYYFNTRINPDIIYTSPLSSIGNNTLFAFGDWTGFKNFNTFLPKSTNRIKTIEGYSSVFSVENESTFVDVRKKNENFDPLSQYKAYLFQDYLKDNNTFNDKFMGSIIGTLSSDPLYLGKKIYEKIANFTDNLSYVDTCNINALKSIYAMLGENFYSFKMKDYDAPADLYRLLDLFSIKFSKLKGSRNKFAEDFDDKGYNNSEIINNGEIPPYGINKGRELNFFTTKLISGKTAKYIVAYERFSDTYKLINTNIKPSQYVKLEPIIYSNIQNQFAIQSNSDSLLQENGLPIGMEQLSGTPEFPLSSYDQMYSLSSYRSEWGWGLVLPKTGWTVYDIPKYYTFYEYIPGYEDSQTEGIINWSDLYTYVPEEIPLEYWNVIRSDITTRYLAKGLELI